MFAILYILMEFAGPRYVHKLGPSKTGAIATTTTTIAGSMIHHSAALSIFVCLQKRAMMMNQRAIHIAVAAAVVVMMNKRAVVVDERAIMMATATAAVEYLIYMDGWIMA